MAINSKVYGWELSRYGLTRSTLRALGDRLVNVEVSISHPPLVNPTGKQLARMVALSPEERAQRVRAWREQQFEGLRRELPDAHAKVIRYNRARIGLQLALPARSVSRLLRLRHAGSVRIVSIRGRREVRLRPKPRLYAIHARMVYVFEGQKHGLQTFEDRIVVLRARSEEQARRRGARHLRREEYVALTTSGHFHGCIFECIVDAETLFDDAVSPSGTEVYYSLKKRRVRRVWHPTA